MPLRTILARVFYYDIGSNDEQTVYERLQEEGEEIARVLMREHGKSMTEVWQEALSLHRVRYEMETMRETERPAPMRRAERA